MEVNHTEFKRCDLVTVTGRVDSATAPKLGDVMSSITERGHFKIVLDLAGLDFISSAGLRILIGTQKSCKRYNRGEVVLTNIQPTILSALDLAGFTPFFKIFDNTTSAVGNF
jgi:anti-sigma B factor antagonist